MKYITMTLERLCTLLGYEVQSLDIWDATQLAQYRDAYNHYLLLLYKAGIEKDPEKVNYAELQPDNKELVDAHTAYIQASQIEKILPNIDKTKRYQIKADMGSDIFLVKEI